jgi:hypothetical protein
MGVFWKNENVNKYIMSSFKDCLLKFVNELNKIAPEDVKVELWVVNSYLTSSMCDHDYVKNVFRKWIDNNREKIENRDTSLFEFNVQGEIAYIINQIGKVWVSLHPEDRATVWVWLDHFVTLV